MAGAKNGVSSAGSDSKERDVSVGGKRANSILDELPLSLFSFAPTLGGMKKIPAL